MPFYIQAKNKTTGEIRSSDIAHAHPEHREDPDHPNYHNAAHEHSLAVARRKSIVYAQQLNEEENTTDWEGLFNPEYYPDPRFPPHG